MKRGTECAAHKHANKVPQEDHHVWPKMYGGPEDGTLVRLCSNGHGDVHYYLALLLKYHGDVPGQLVWQFGKKTRQLAEQGYASMERAMSRDQMYRVRMMAEERFLGDD